MKDERLSDLLRHADGPAEKTFGVTADGARRAAKRRIRRWRIASGALVALLSVGFATSFVTRDKIRGNHDTIANSHDEAEDPSAKDVDVVELRARIEAEVQARLDHRRVLAWIAEVDPMDPAEARDEAARTMVLTAPRRAEVAGNQEAAILYERTIELFPETRWAAVARDELVKLEQPK